jgi:hypothetical protein
MHKSSFTIQFVRLLASATKQSFSNKHPVAYSLVVRLTPSSQVDDFLSCTIEPGIG